MEIIKSRSNPVVKDAINLKLKKFRQERLMALIEGIKIFEEALKEEFKFVKIFCTQEKYDEYNLKKFNCPIIVCSRDIIEYISTEKSPQGVIAIIQTKKFQFKKPSSNFLVLDSLQDPSNLGAIIRTAVATNFKDIYLINCCDIYNEKTIRSSMGNLFKCNFYDVKYEDIKDFTHKMYIADMKGKNVFEVNNFDEIVGLVIGNEGHGVSKEIKNLVVNYFSIPMENNVESLNASVSAGILMYHITTRQKEIK